MLILVISLIAVLVGGYFLFRDTMNRLQYLGKVYWITRNNAQPDTPRFAKAFMRGTSPPWKVGKGIQFRLFSFTFQVGICHNGPKAENEVEGLMNVLGARLLSSKESAYSETA